MSGHDNQMWPFFSFYGGKWRSAPRYPAPRHGVVIEPFAGSAGYSVRHAGRDVVLIERDPAIAALWRYLIAASPSDILALPLLGPDDTVDDFNLSPAEKTLIGFWLNKGAASACRRPSAWMRSGVRPKSYWGQEIRGRIAAQVGKIGHWTVIEGDYSQAPDVEATWFIDPPYVGAGSLYRYSAKDICFPSLAEWCMARKGQVMVCENEGADWLPFSPFIVAKSTPGSRGKSKSREALWVK